MTLDDLSSDLRVAIKDNVEAPATALDISEMIRVTLAEMAEEGCAWVRQRSRATVKDRASTVALHMVGPPGVPLSAMEIVLSTPGMPTVSLAVSDVEVGIQGVSLDDPEPAATALLDAVDRIAAVAAGSALHAREAHATAIGLAGDDVEFPSVGERGACVVDLVHPGPLAPSRLVCMLLHVDGTITEEIALDDLALLAPSVAISLERRTDSGSDNLSIRIVPLIDGLDPATVDPIARLRAFAALAELRNGGR